MDQESRWCDSACRLWPSLDFRVLLGGLRSIITSIVVIIHLWHTKNMENGVLDGIDVFFVTVLVISHEQSADMARDKRSCTKYLGFMSF